MEDEELTPPQVAVDPRVRVSRQAVARWCREGKLRARRVGGRWRILRSDLDRFLDTYPEEVEQEQN